MNRLVLFLLLASYVFMAFLFLPIKTEMIVGLLLAIIILCLSFFFDHRILSYIMIEIYCVSGVFFPEFYLFLPLICTEIARLRLHLHSILPISALGLVMHFPPLDILGLGNHSDTEVSGIFTRHVDFSFSTLYLLLFGCILGYGLECYIQKYHALEKKYVKSEDKNRERHYLLRERNKLLLEKQDYEVHTAMLQERNRIAREIHDNAGHILSRCILLTGVLKTINTDEACAPTLQTLSQELDDAMNSIRGSVHNLHEESLDLETKLTQIASQFSFCPATLEYDVQTPPPGDIKYAFLSIAKEALTNVTKHSNATHVHIRVIEHPSMYQLIIQDNGSKISRQIQESFSTQVEEDFEDITQTSGIGLTNMRDRVNSLNGTLHIQTDRGFRVFISAPRK